MNREEIQKLRAKKASRIILVVMILVSLLSIGVGLYRYYFVSGADMYDLIPENPLVAVELQSVQDDLKEAQDSKFWEALKGLNYDLIFNQEPNGRQQKEQFEDAVSKITEVFSNPVMQKVFQDKVFVGYYSPDVMSAITNPDPRSFMQLGERFLNSFVIVTKVPLEVQIGESVASVKSNFGENVSVAKQEYNGEQVLTLIFNDLGLQLGYTRVKEYLIIGFGDVMAKRCIDVYKQKEPSLSQDKVFLHQRNQFSQEDGQFAFLNLESGVDGLSRIYEKGLQLNVDQAGLSPAQKLAVLDRQKKFESALVEIKKNYIGFISLGLKLSYSEALNLDFSLLFDSLRMTGNLGKFYQNCRSVKNKTYEFIPEDTLGYQWQSCFDLGFFWDQMKAQFDEIARQTGNDPSVAIQTAEENMGIRIEEDVLEAFGDEIGGYLSDIVTGQMFPVPKLALFVKAKDQAKMDALIGKIQNKVKVLMFQSEEYKGVDISYLYLPFGEDLQPSYAYLGDYFLLAVSRATIKSSIDAMNDENSRLVKSKKFLQMNLSEADKNMMVQYFDFYQLGQKVKAVVEWANQFKSQKENQELAFQAGQKKRLEDVQAQKREMERVIRGLEDDLKDLLGRPDADGTVAVKIQSVKTDLDARNLDLAELNRQEEKLQEYVGGYQGAMDTSMDRELMQKEFIFPALDTLKYINGYSAQFKMTDDTWKGNFSLKVE